MPPNIQNECPLLSGFEDLFSKPRSSVKIKRKHAICVFVGNVIHVSKYKCKRWVQGIY